MFGRRSIHSCCTLDGCPFLARVRSRGGTCGNLGEQLRQVEIEVSDPTLVDDLIESLRAAQFIVARTGTNTVDARFGWPLREDAARLELDLYLRVWCAKNWGARAVRVD
jgi:hypothetical protein